MPGAKRRPMTLDSTTGRREGRVHHDCMVALVRRQQIIETLRVERCRREPLQGEQLTSAGIDFIGLDVCAGQPREYRDVARTGARLQHLHAGTDRSHYHNHQRERGRRAELLEIDLGLVAPRLPGQTRLLGQELIDGGGHVAEVKADSAQVEIESRFGRIVGVPGVPGGVAEYLLRQSTQRRVVQHGRGIPFQHGGTLDRQPCTESIDGRSSRYGRRFPGRVEVEQQLPAPRFPGWFRW